MNYNLLVVDDEQFAIEAIVCGIDWKAMGISEVFSANNAQEALNVLSTHKISIIICDIQMPKTNGIELMHMVLEEQPDIRFVFLTAYDYFEYAQKSIELSCYRYLLKPVDYALLGNVISELIVKIKQTEKAVYYEDEYLKYLRLWNDRLPTLKEKFYQDVISGRLNITKTNMTMVAADFGVNIGENDEFIVIHIASTPDILSDKDDYDDVISYGVRNIAAEIFEHMTDSVVFQEYDGNNVVLLRADELCREIELSDLCYKLIEVCSRGLMCSLSCYISGRVCLHEIKTAFETLLRLDKSSINKSREVTFALHVVNLPASEANEVVAVSEVKKYIYENYASEITRTELANKVYLNPSYLSRLFKRTEGVSISDFITAVRIQKSKQLLGGVDNISEVGLKVGYGNVSHFSKMFKKLTGMTPHEYRQTIKSQ